MDTRATSGTNSATACSAVSSSPASATTSTSGCAVSTIRTASRNRPCSSASSTWIASRPDGFVTASPCRWSNRYIESRKVGQKASPTHRAADVGHPTTYAVGSGAPRSPCRQIGRLRRRELVRVATQERDRDRRRQQIVGGGERNRAQPRVDLELREDALDVAADGVHADREAAGDLLVAGRRRHHADHLQLPLGELGDQQLLVAALAPPGGGAARDPGGSHALAPRRALDG